MKKTIKLVIFDLDNTLTTGPTIWELIHRENKTWHSHGLPFWRDYRKGLFGINSFIRKDVACWKGLSLSKLNKAAKLVRYIHGAEKTIRALKKLGIRTALVSSSVEQFARYAANKFRIDHVFANPVEVKRGKLTGKVTLNVPGNGKGKVTSYLKKCLHLKKKEVLAIGDSVHDLPLFKECGITVSFNDAAPRVQKMVDHVISKKQLKKLLKIVHF